MILLNINKVINSKFAIFFLKIKIKVNNKYFHIKVMDYLPHENKAPQIISMQNEQSESSEILYF